MFQNYVDHFSYFYISCHSRLETVTTSPTQPHLAFETLCWNLVGHNIGNMDPNSLLPHCWHCWYWEVATEMESNRNRNREREERSTRVVTKRWSVILFQQVLCTPGGQPLLWTNGWLVSFFSLRARVGHGFAGLESGQLTWPPFSLSYLNVIMGSGFVRSHLCPFPHPHMSFKKSPR